MRMVAGMCYCACVSDENKTPRLKHLFWWFSRFYQFVNETLVGRFPVLESKIAVQMNSSTLKLTREKLLTMLQNFHNFL